MGHDLPVKHNDIKDLASPLRDRCKNLFSVILRQAQDKFPRQTQDIVEKRSDAGTEVPLSLEGPRKPRKEEFPGQGCPTIESQILRFAFEAQGNLRMTFCKGFVVASNSIPSCLLSNFATVAGFVLWLSSALA